MRKNPKLKPDVYEQLKGLIHPKQSLPLLQHLHILTPEGRINQDSRRKLKQVMHLAQFIARLLPQKAPENDTPKPFNLVDLGAGKSYLGFILYDLFFKDLDSAHVYAVEMRSELVASSEALKTKLGFERFEVIESSVNDAVQDKRIAQRLDIVTALHACDTATDDAIAFGLEKQAKHMVLVPCCQAEVAAKLRQNKALHTKASPLSELWRHPLHTREFGSQLTNVLRCLYLESMGYQVSVTELVGWEHSMKNELIVASYTGAKIAASREKMRQLLEETGLLQALGVRFGF